MRVAVIGGGAIGLLCAHHLRKRGAEVVVLERDRVGEACSSGNAGWISPSIALPLPGPGLRAKSIRWMLSAESPLYIRPSAAPSMAGWLLRFWRHCNRDDFAAGARALAELGAETMELFDQLAEDGVEFESSKSGLLMVFRDRRGLDEELALMRAASDLPIQELTGNELREMEPSLATDLQHGAYVPTERTVRPETLSAGVSRALVASGGEVREGCRVTGLTLEGSSARSARLQSGDPIEADAFLIATGAEAAQISRQVGVPLPIQAGKGYSTTVEAPSVKLRYPLYLGDPKIGVTPFAGGVRVAGSMELSGVNLDFDKRRSQAIERAAERDVPGVLDGSEPRRWVGMRPLTPDGLPVLGPLAPLSNVFVATGHQMLGITLAASTGKAMAELILEGRSQVDLEPFAATRFT